jgi:hypothetical protein
MTVNVIQSVLEKYGFDRTVRSHVGDSFYVWQDEIDDIYAELNKLGFMISVVDLVNAGQETALEYEGGVFLYTSRTGENLHFIHQSRQLNQLMQPNTDVE